MFKKFVTICGILGILGCIGCSQLSTYSEAYSRCNESSKLTMAESKDGFFYAYESLLYYADKDDMSTWVPVCNKPDCKHKVAQQYGDVQCNAYVPTSYQVIDKNGKLYVVDYELGLWVYEILKDGSGLKKIYEVPIGDEFLQSDTKGYSFGMSQDELVFSYRYLDEKGITQNYLGTLIDDSVKILDQGEEYVSILSGKMMWNINGDDTYIIPTLQDMKEGDNIYNTQVLWRLAEDATLEKVNFPEYIDLYQTHGAHLSGDVFTYFIQNEGFYECNLETGEKTLLFENQLEDSKGYVLTDECLIEWNRYVGECPEDAAIKIYYQDKWIDVEIPEEIKNSEDRFIPVSVASDRIFFRLEIPTTKTYNSVPKLYYLMLEDENPQLVCSGTIIEVKEEDIKTKEEDDEIVFTPQDITVFDNEQCLLKVTGLYINNKSGAIQIETKLELRGEWEYDEESSQTSYDIYITSVAVNGIEFHPGNPYLAVRNQIQNEQKEEIYPLSYDKDELLKAGILMNYSAGDYTDIELNYSLSSQKRTEEIETATVHLYPKGEIQEEETQDNNPNDTILIDNDDFKISVERYEETLIPNDTVTLLLENKTDTELEFLIRELTINGVGITHKAFSDNQEGMNVSGGKKGYLTVTIHSTVSGEDQGLFFEETGITEVGVIGLLIDVKDFSNDELFASKAVFLYPNGIENTLSYEREKQATDMILVDNEYITLMVIGYEETVSGLKNGDVKLYLKNKTKEVLHFTVGDNKWFIGVGKVNGMETNVTIPSFIYYILPESSSYFNVQINKPSSDATITVAENMEISFKVRKYEGYDDGTVLVEETVTLTP